MKLKVLLLFAVLLVPLLAQPKPRMVFADGNPMPICGPTTTHRCGP